MVSVSEDGSLERPTYFPPFELAQQFKDHLGQTREPMHTLWNLSANTYTYPLPFGHILAPYTYPLGTEPRVFPGYLRTQQLIIPTRGFNCQLQVYLELVLLGGCNLSWVGIHLNRFDMTSHFY